MAWASTSPALKYWLFIGLVLLAHNLSDTYVEEHDLNAGSQTNIYTKEHPSNK